MGLYIVSDCKDCGLLVPSDCGSLGGGDVATLPTNDKPQITSKE